MIKNAQKMSIAQCVAVERLYIATEHIQRQHLSFRHVFAAIG